LKVLDTDVCIEPFALKDAPALIEAVFPAQKVSFEAQRERKANLGQTLTALGSYWKGRKPLILVRAILLGSLRPQTEGPEQDLGSSLNSTRLRAPR
jgi:putative DNA methylase